MTMRNLDADGLSAFCEDTQSRLDEIASTLIEIESGCSRDAAPAVEAIGQIRKESEELALDAIAGVCGSMADYIAKTPAGRLGENIQILLDACDFISAYVETLSENREPPRVSAAILEGLRQPGRPYEAASAASDVGETTPERPRFLIVDDELASRELLKAYLSPFGACDLVESGRQAVDAVRKSLIEKRPYAAVCLDIMMPEVDGHLALKLIRCCENEFEIYGSAGAKVFMITALGKGRHEVRAFKAGCQTYLTKPVDEQELIGTMRRMGVFWNTLGDRRAIRFRDKDVTTVVLKPDAANAQESEVADESHGGIGLLVEDVSHLRPGLEVELTYMGAPQRAIVRSIQPPCKDGRSLVGLQWK